MNLFCDFASMFSLQHIANFWKNWTIALSNRCMITLLNTGYCLACTPKKPWRFICQLATVQYWGRQQRSVCTRLPWPISRYQLPASAKRLMESFHWKQGRGAIVFTKRSTSPFKPYFVVSLHTETEYEPHQEPHRSHLWVPWHGHPTPFPALCHLTVRKKAAKRRRRDETTWRRSMWWCGVSERTKKCEDDDEVEESWWCLAKVAFGCGEWEGVKYYLGVGMSMNPHGTL